MHLFRASVGLLVLGFSLAGQSGGDGRFTVAGRVVNGLTGEPLARAMVTCMSAYARPVPGQTQAPWTRSQSAAFSDAAGNFRFENLEAGRYQISAKRPQFECDPVTTDSLPLEVGPSRDNLEIRMMPLSSIEGRVTDQDGNGVPRARVEVYEVKIVEGARSYWKARTVTTDDQGSYRTWNFAPGQYVIRAAGKAGGTARMASDQMPRTEWPEAFEAIYHGGGKHKTAAPRLVLGYGVHQRADIMVAMQPAFKVRGRLTNAINGQDIKIALLTEAGEEVACRSAYNPASGNFEINDVVPGSYRVRASQGERAVERRGETEVRVGAADTNGVEVALSEGLTIEGTTVCDSAPAADQSRGAGCRALVTLTEDDNPTPIYSRNDSERDGAMLWKLKPVFPGNYHLRTRGIGKYVASITAGGVPLDARGRITILPGASLPPWELTLKSNPGTAAVELSGEAAGSAVLLVPSASVHEEPKLVQQCKNPCEFTWLAPGEYTVFAVKDATQLEYKNPEVISAWMNGVRVTVREKAKETVSVERLAR